jgi:hypothetical protein
MERELLTEETAPSAVAQAVAELPQYSGGFEDRGIVIPGGGTRYFPSAWVCIRMLREFGCNLPIELWHLGDSELSAEMRALVEPLGVTCRDALEVRRLFPVKFVAGWALKPFAILHSRFREVLLLDADNSPVIDPSFLFEVPEYKRTGAVLWPDETRLAPDDPVWGLMGIAYRDEPEVESGQVLVDKRRCWGPLALTSWMNNEHADFWYRYIYGDKDTFHLAWNRLDVDYAMPGHRMLRLPATMVQHDFQGRPLFQHRHGNKWSFDSQMLRIEGFAFEERCRAHFVELSSVWRGRPAATYRHDLADPRTSAVAERLCARRWILRAAGEKSRVIAFGIDGRVRDGGGPREQTWTLLVHATDSILAIRGVDGIAWMLAEERGGRWMGQAPAEPDRSVELTPVLAEE